MRGAWKAGALLAAGAGLVWGAKAFASAPRGGSTIVTEASRLEFVRRVWAAIVEATPNLGSTALATRVRVMILAHAAYETGWGITTGYRLGNNLFNITRSASDAGPVVSGPDTECDASGNCRPITQRFRAYGSLAESVRDYIAFLSASRYAASLKLLLAGDLGFAEALGKAGYYTLPIAKYVSSYRAMIDSVVKRLRGLDLIPATSVTFTAFGRFV